MKANKLINSKSLYLLQHAHNPVDWYPWGEEALQKAKKEQKPLLVSIGYSACHWCHVMEKESFENQEVADLMNKDFVCIKIDREERPDLDNIYMEAVQVMGLQGGWPLNVFLMPDQKPFYGGTYFPKNQWMKVLSGISTAFVKQYKALNESALGFGNSLNRSLTEKYGLQSNDSPFLAKEIITIARELMEGFDPQWGGMNRVPKFPMPAIWSFLLDMAILNQDKELGKKVCFTLEKMGRGGIYDQLTGGFCRYSVDGEWFAPHFEKMLYDNGQLLSLYAKAFQYSQNGYFKEKVVETIHWLENEMLDSAGAFYAALDADSEGKEGKFYTWTFEELQSLLKDDFDWFASLYGIKKNGNWESGENILFQQKNYFETAESLGLSEADFQQKLKAAKRKLIEYRNQRERPGLDDKIISGWNGWVIDGLSQAFLALGNDAYKNLAHSAGEFIWQQMVKGGELFRNFKSGEAYTSAFLEDYAAVIKAYISLYTISFDPKWLYRAEQLLERVLERFLDKSDSLFYFNDPAVEQLIADKKEVFDNVIPASNSVMARNLHQLGLYFYKDKYLNQAEKMLQLIQDLLQKEPSFLTNWASFYLEKTTPTAEIAVTGPGAEKKALTFLAGYRPNLVISASSGDSKLPLLQDKPMVKSLFYVCFNKSCKQPVEEVADALNQLPYLS
ncbi:thioredoxin domain-containing protein [Cyclobacterium sp.]|uniref:thioredoxin domain-containing protein n=1 Tax=Cyclobacterium sp. TaxID=1966343 RepID=UPI0019BEC9A4|nr:thioredoxin domain-containing protein [Cyclobacterium sp.]MBD3629095.1 thioredoxin domain-containing protein [Cyclobacterium sp.]